MRCANIVTYGTDRISWQVYIVNAPLLAHIPKHCTHTHTQFSLTSFLGTRKMFAFFFFLASTNKYKRFSSLNWTRNASNVIDVEMYDGREWRLSTAKINKNFKWLNKCIWMDRVNCTNACKAIKRCSRLRFVSLIFFSASVLISEIAMASAIFRNSLNNIILSTNGFAQNLKAMQKGRSMRHRRVEACGLTSVRFRKVLNQCLRLLLHRYSLFEFLFETLSKQFQIQRWWCTFVQRCISFTADRRDMWQTMSTITI